MGSRIEAMITADVLRWARETIALPLEEAARKLKVKAKQLAEWEAGTARPTINQLQLIANLYKRPIAIFFLPKRPADRRPPRDYRRLPEQRAARFSPLPTGPPRKQAGDAGPTLPTTPIPLRFGRFAAISG